MRISCAFRASPTPATIGSVTPARRDIDRQIALDRQRPTCEPVLWARMRAVVDARRAVSEGDQGAASALRQSLVDLAAVAELVAGDLAAPSS